MAIFIATAAAAAATAAVRMLAIGDEVGEERDAARQDAEAAAIGRQLRPFGDQPLVGCQEESKRSALNLALSDRDDRSAGARELLQDGTFATEERAALLC